MVQKNINDVRVVGATSLADILTWIDAAYAVHTDMKNHTDGIMSMGIRALHSKASTQKLNTKNSTEVEIVGVNELLPYNIWIMNFMNAQGYTIKNNIIYQDNQSGIRMEKNRRNSCTGNSRDIDVVYFFMKDRDKKKEVSIQY